MRRAALALVGTIAGLVVLLSFKTHSAVTTPPAAIGSANTGDGGTPGPQPPASSASSGPAAGPTSAPAAKASSSKKVTGDTADTQWGPVQVQLTVKNGKITAVDLLQYPNGNPRDAEINSYAVPQLVQETLSAQSARIDTISGATVTSDGYLTSLQSALDKAGL